MESSAFSSSLLQSIGIPQSILFIDDSAFGNVSLSSTLIESGNDLKQIRTWHELNWKYFIKHHFDQSRFQGMLKFLDRNVFHLVTHYRQSHLNQIRI
jgi:hypothetical protein